MRHLLFFLLWISVWPVFAQDSFKAPSLETVANKMNALPPHPRLLFLKADEAVLKNHLKSDPYRQNLHRAILEECETFLTLPPVERIQIGRRLLDKSREALRRIFQLSYAYRMSKDDRFLKRAEQELLAVAAFSDWNPSHFLDVAEMTAAVAIGYDWLFDQLSESSKATLRTALIEKGIKQSYDSKYNWFLTSEHNWNQVCNAGMTFGALAIAENERDLAIQTVHRAIETTPKSMTPYAPDGAYPEGYGYWGYGTSFNVLLVSALEVALGTDFGLSNTPGFLATGKFLQHMIGPNYLVHNWGDSGLQAGLNPALFWFAEKTHDTSILWNQKGFLDGSQPISAKNRLLPTALVWGLTANLSGIKEPKSFFWSGQGPSAVAMMRSSWSNPDAFYVGFKAGSANVNHAHMDVGSFVLDALGERWAMDFGPQDYHSLETRGIKLFGRTQDAERWSIFRYNNLVHNTLTIDNQLHRVDGYARIDKVSENPNYLAAVSDLTAAFSGQAQSVRRGVALKDKKQVIVRDEIEAPNKDIRVRWTTLTRADVKIIGKNTVELTQNGKKMFVTFAADTEFQLKTWPTEPPKDYDAPNPGTALFGLETTIPAGKSHAIEVVFSTEPGKRSAAQPLAKWPTKDR
jgi:hypothetical protein